MMESLSAGEFVAFDLETTGLFAETDRIVEIGAIRFGASGRESGRFERLVNPGRPMSPSALAIHGINDHDLDGQPGAEVVLPEFLAFLGDPAETTLLAHNASFDAGFLGRELTRLGLPLPGYDVIDTLPMARRRWPMAPDHRLDTLARLLNLDTGGSHRAVADCGRVKGLCLALAKGPEPMGALVSYPIHDPVQAVPAPAGWDLLTGAMERGSRVRLVYRGGTRPRAPREITPLRYAHRGGIAYVVAHCHLAAYEKSFRLDRVEQLDLIDPLSSLREPSRAGS